MFESEVFTKLLKPCLNFDVASSIDEAWDTYLRFKENILHFVPSLKTKTFIKLQCQFFDNELLNLKQKREKQRVKQKVENIFTKI